MLSHEKVGKRRIRF